MVKGLVLPLFIVSGATGLVYEVVWTRAFGVIFGNTVFAASTVLTAFMLGLAIGSWLFGKVGDRGSRPLRLYAILELGIGAYAFTFPALLRATDNLYGRLYLSFNPSFYPRSLILFGLSLIILIVPTALMGGTLPVLSKLWIDLSGRKNRDVGIGQSVGLLYATNTFGAVMGSFLSGYILMRILGVGNTIHLAASANVIVGLIAFILSRFAGHQETDRATVTFKPGHSPRGIDKPYPSDSHAEVEEKITRERIIAMAAIALAGFCALALEVLWTRVLVFVLGTSVYAFVCMLTCCIFGIAVGSFFSSRVVLKRVKNPIFSLGLVELLLAISVVASIVALGRLWRIDYFLIGKVVGEKFSFPREVAAHFLDGAIVLLVPTILMGMAFPIAVKICASSRKTVSRRVGQVYACNTVGCVLGSFIAGFVMVPFLGLRDSFLVILTIQLFLAVGVILLSEKRRSVVTVPVVIVSLVIIVGSIVKIPRDVFLRTINTYNYPSEIVYMKDDASGTVTVHDVPDGDRLISVDGVNVAGMNLMLRTTQKLQGYVPLIVHENPKKVLQIGFGSGETAGVGLGWGVEQYSIVEICPGVFEAGRFFDKINRGSYRNPALRKIIMDGKNFVKLTGEKFDVIMNDSTYPGTTGSSALYTYDHFKQCRDHLNEGGVLSCWMPLDLRPADFRIIIRSFQAVMPYCSLWMGQNTLNKHAVLLGTLSPMQIDFQRVKNLVERPNIASDLAEININSVYDLLDCFVAGQEGLRKIAGAGPLNTDDKPALEFGAAIKRDIEGCWIVIISWITDNYLPMWRHVTNLGRTEQESQQVREVLERYSVCTMHTLRAFLGLLQGDSDITHNEFDAAIKANPQDRDVQSCMDELRQETTALEDVVRQAPTNVELRLRLAKRYLLLRDYKLAAEEYNRFLSLEPANAAGWNNLGICYKGLERFDKAVEAFERAIACDARMIAAYYNVSGVYLRLGKSPAAIGWLQKALSFAPPAQKGYIYDKLAWAYLAQKDYNSALGAIDAAIKLAAGQPVLVEQLEQRKAAIKRAAETERPTKN